MGRIVKLFAESAEFCGRPCVNTARTLHKGRTSFKGAPFSPMKSPLRTLCTLLSLLKVCEYIEGEKRGGGERVGRLREKRVDGCFGVHMGCMGTRKKLHATLRRNST